MQMGFLGSGLGRYSTRAVEKTNKQTVKKISAESYQELIDIKKLHLKWDREHQPLFRNIGMCVSLILVIIVFNWRTSEEGAIADLGSVNEDISEILDIPISEQPPPPPPKTHEVFTIKEVEDTEVLEEIDISLDVEVTEQTVIEEVVFEATAEIEEEKVETIFTIVESEPEPVGGLKAWNEYLLGNINYPKQAIRLQVTGKVYVEFVVEKDGSLTDIKVVKGIGAGCDKEAIRVIDEAPNWVPGKQRGVPVRVRKIIPIHFKLSERS